jgi:hypothetical protein
LGGKEKMFYASYTTREAEDRLTESGGLPNIPINGLLAERQGVPMTIENIKHYASISKAASDRESPSDRTSPGTSNSSGAPTVDTRPMATPWDSVIKPNGAASMKSFAPNVGIHPGADAVIAQFTPIRHATQVPFGASNSTPPSNKLPQPRSNPPQSAQSYKFPFRSADPSVQPLPHNLGSWPDHQPQLPPEPEPPAFYLADPPWLDSRSFINDPPTDHELDALLDGIVWDSNSLQESSG